MLSVLPLHAIVLGSCEKAGRHDAAPHGCGMEPRKRRVVWTGGGGGRINPHSPRSPRPGVSAQPKPWQRFTLMRDFFTAIARVNQAGQGEMAATHAMPLLKGRGGGREGKRSDRTCREKQTKLSDFPFI